MSAHPTLSFTVEGEDQPEMVWRAGEYVAAYLGFDRPKSLTEAIVLLREMTFLVAWDADPEAIQRNGLGRPIRATSWRADVKLELNDDAWASHS